MASRKAQRSLFRKTKRFVTHPSINKVLSRVRQQEVESPAVKNYLFNPNIFELMVRNLPVESIILWKDEDNRIQVVGGKEIILHLLYVMEGRNKLFVKIKYNRFLGFNFNKIDSDHLDLRDVLLPRRRFKLMQDNKDKEEIIVDIANNILQYPINLEEIHCNRFAMEKLVGA